MDPAMTSDELSILAGPGTVLSPGRLLLGAVLICLAITLATAAIVSLVRRDRQRLGATTRRLCRAMRIRASDRRLLERLARALAGPVYAASLLVSRGCFDAAASRATPCDARRLTSLRRRVFGDATRFSAP